MDFLKLLYFKTLAETHNYTRAAEKLFISQSNLSEQIKKIEEEVGVLLVLRNRRKLSLTSEGEKFLSFCNATLNNYDNLLNEIKETKQVVTVGVFFHPKLVEWFDKLEKFNQSQSKIHFDYELIHDVYLEQNIFTQYDIVFYMKKWEPISKRFKSVTSIGTGIYSSQKQRHTINIADATVYYHDFEVTGREICKNALRKAGYYGNVIRKSSNDEIYVALERENTVAFLYESAYHLENLSKIQDMDIEIEMGWYYEEEVPGIQWVLNNLK